MYRYVLYSLTTRHSSFPFSPHDFAEWHDLPFKKVWNVFQPCWYLKHALNHLLSLQWGHYGHGGVLNHQTHDCLLNRLLRRRSKETSKLRVTGLCEGNSPVIGEFPAQRASNAENVSIWWRHHDLAIPTCAIELIEPKTTDNLTTKEIQWIIEWW